MSSTGPPKGASPPSAAATNTPLMANDIYEAMLNAVCDIPVSEANIASLTTRTSNWTRKHQGASPDAGLVNPEDWTPGMMIVPSLLDAVPEELRSNLPANDAEAATALLNGVENPELSAYFVAQLFNVPTSTELVTDDDADSEIYVASGPYATNGGGEDDLDVAVDMIPAPPVVAGPNAGALVGHGTPLLPVVDGAAAVGGGLVAEPSAPRRRTRRRGTRCPRCGAPMQEVSTNEGVMEPRNH